MRHPGGHSLALGWCLCLLYSGYELARASSLALFNKSDAGLSGALTSAVSFVLSVAMLGVYGVGAEALGGKWTLVVSAGGCCVVFLAFAFACFGDAVFGRTVVCGLYAFREMYVALIATQVWGLLSAALKQRGERESRRWFCIIQGVSCICSAFSGVAAGRLATAGGQAYLLLAAALSLGTITVTAVALTPVKAGGWGVEKVEGKTGKKKSDHGMLSVLRSSASLFRQSPLLAALLAEATVCQVLVATLNLSFNEAIRQGLPPEEASGETGARAAGFVGNSFAVIGLVSGILQLVVMPWAMVRVNPSLLLKTLPVVAGGGFLVTFVSPGFRTATVAFSVTKILEYSVRGTVLELVYQAMADDERRLGKEAIATVGVRIGRTTAQVLLYLCSAVLGGTPPQRALMGVALVLSVAWGATIRKVEALARRGGGPLPSPPPSPSKQRGVPPVKLFTPQASR
ncbi:unnamed protein product, partial [Ectocarpus sp. 6 AP-2014]